MTYRRRTFLFAAAIGLFFGFHTLGFTSERRQEAPQLVVLISVDQLRGDMVERYRPALTGGLKRFLDQGWTFTQASHAHAVTATAAGHATLSTGVFPSRHGIVGNNWNQMTPRGWEAMYAVADVDSPILGYTGVEGRSPKNLVREGLADWVLAADPEARAASISLKDRAAIPFGGKGTKDVYWMIPEVAAFVTSDHYAVALPRWVTGFNEGVMREIAADTVWQNPIPEAYWHLARTDSAGYEGDGTHSKFPHLSAPEIEVLGGDLPAHNEWAFTQPRADRAVLELAKVALDELELGQRGHVDYLGVSLSALDRVGHQYGPFSQEAFATVYELDRELGRFFDYLDETVGEGRWTAALSADHGVLSIPEGAAEAGVEQDGPEAIRTDSRALNQQFSAALQDAAAMDAMPQALAGNLAQIIQERGLAAGAYTHWQLTRGGEPADSFQVLYRNSHYPGRAHSLLSRFGVEMRYAENELVSGIATGTTHLTPYWYDRHVPLMFLGNRVFQGSSDRPVHTVDVAPTLAALAGIPVPTDLDGISVLR